MGMGLVVGIWSAIGVCQEYRKSYHDQDLGFGFLAGG